ncbi:hypothetical protein LguiB_035650 [Lonicera macranthoides]
MTHEDNIGSSSNMVKQCESQNLDEKMSDALHSHIEEQGINESLFPFLQAWLYVKDHRKLMHCFKSMATFINEDMHGYDA